MRIVIRVLLVAAAFVAPARADDRAPDPGSPGPSDGSVPIAPNRETVQGEASDGDSAVVVEAPAAPSADEPSGNETSSSPDAPELGLFGIGLLLGQPIGATAKVFLAPAHALQFVLGFDLVYLDAGIVSVDYLWHPTSIHGTSVFEFTWHVGLGAALGVWPAGRDYDCAGGDPMTGGTPMGCKTAWVHPGVRVPLGIEMAFRDVPLELYVEFAPGLFAYPEVEFLGQGGFGARWYL